MIAYENNVKSDLREGRTLSPDGAVVADDGRGGEVVSCAIDIAHQVVIYVSLPRHIFLIFQSLLLLLLILGSLWCNCVVWVWN